MVEKDRMFTDPEWKSKRLLIALLCFINAVHIVVVVNAFSSP